MKIVKNFEQKIIIFTSFINLCIIRNERWQSKMLETLNEPRCEKTGLRGLQPGPTQTGLYNHRRWLAA